MTIEITEHRPHEKGLIYTIRIQETTVDILLLTHAMERIKRWAIPEERVFETLLMPEEVISGHRDRYIAHRRYGNNLVRAVYEYEGLLPVLVTVYFPNKDRYFKGGGFFEDQILQRS
jgi:hypothetical protein